MKFNKAFKVLRQHFNESVAINIQKEQWEHSGYKRGKDPVQFSVSLVKGRACVLVKASGLHDAVYKAISKKQELPGDVDVKPSTKASEDF